MYQCCRFGERAFSLNPPLLNGARAESAYLYFSAWGGYAEICLLNINQYPNGIRSLRGCLTDVELQWELLVHRFGFSPKDILVVADRKLAFTDIALTVRRNWVKAGWHPPEGFEQ